LEEAEGECYGGDYDECGSCCGVDLDRKNNLVDCEVL
jgi:hypothetical protein